MKILSFGSSNIDKVLSLDYFPKVGESILVNEMKLYLGGKGMNQTVAIAKAGSEVYYGGKIGFDGDFITDSISELDKIRLDYLLKDDKADSGQAFVLVDPNADNIGIVYGGTNQTITEDEIDEILVNFSEGDVLVTQNETSNVPYLLEQAGKKGMMIFFTPAPFKKELSTMRENRYVNWFLLNEIEGAYLSHKEGTPEEIAKALVEMYPESKVVLTLGEKGSICYDGTRFIRQNAYKVNAVDTTGAGDTFAGYFVSQIAKGSDIKTSLDFASKASAIAVSRKGAAPAIPTYDEVISWKF